jgi:hypothetical protein
MAPLKNFMVLLLSGFFYGYMQLQQSPCKYKCILSLNVVCASFHLVGVSIFIFLLYIGWYFLMCIVSS